MSAARFGRGASLAFVAAGAAVAIVVYVLVVKPMLDPPAATYSDVSVIDGDTIEAINTAGDPTRIRILGIDAPERGECGGADATAHLSQLLDGTTQISAASDSSQPEHDRYNRVLAYIELEDGTDIGLSMIQAGYATELTISKPHDRASEYLVAADAARIAKVGAWATCPT